MDQGSGTPPTKPPPGAPPGIPGHLPASPFAPPRAPAPPAPGAPVKKEAAKTVLGMPGMFIPPPGAPPAPVPVPAAAPVPSPFAAPVPVPRPPEMDATMMAHPGVVGQMAPPQPAFPAPYPAPAPAPVPVPVPVPAAAPALAQPPADQFAFAPPAPAPGPAFADAPAYPPPGGPPPGAPPYGYGAPGAFAAAPPSKGRAGKIVLLIVLALLVLGGGGFILYWFVLRGGSTCERLCDRTAECGKELAAKSGVAAPPEAEMQKMRTECVQQCGKEGTDAERDKAAKCLDKSGCEAFFECLEGEVPDRSGEGGESGGAAGSAGAPAVAPAGGSGGGAVADCAGYVERSIACNREMAGAAFSADMEKQIREAMETSCRAWDSLGQTAKMLAAIKTCDGKTACLDWSICTAEALLKTADIDGP